VAAPLSGKAAALRLISWLSHVVYLARDDQGAAPASCM